MTEELFDVPEPAAICPLCHTLDRAVSAESLQAGAFWRCARCGQMWSAARLATSAAYARFVAGQGSSRVLLGRFGASQPGASSVVSS
jgi:hypothetical protein